MKTPHRNIRESEEGFISILGCFMLMAVLFCGSALAYLARNEIESINRYQAEVKLHYAAKSCMEQAVSKLETQHISDASEELSGEKCLLEREFPDKIKVIVHAREKDGAIILMSRAEQDELWGVAAYKAVYGYMKKEEEYYVWAGWFEQGG